jgi:RecA-family ATPase
MSTRANPSPTPKGPRQHRPDNHAFKIEFKDSKTFDEATFERDWLIDKILVRGLPGVIGGPLKSLKTSLVVAMAISLSSGQPFLARFPVPARRRVAVLSGESDPATLRETAQRVCAAASVSLKDCDVLWGSALPRLSQPEHLRALGKFLPQNNIEVVFIDPLYRCLLPGTRGASASNLYEVGPLLWQAGDTCLEAGATPLLVHHTSKSANKQKKAADRPLDAVGPSASNPTV